jgi:hypothetical protein
LATFFTSEAIFPGNISGIKKSNNSIPAITIPEIFKTFRAVCLNENGIYNRFKN